MNACRSFRRALPALLESELGIERTLELEEHARGCRACGAELARERALLEALLALPEPPIEHLDVERNVAAVLARLEPAPARRSARPRLVRFLPWLVAAGLAAALVWRRDRPHEPERAPIVALSAPGPEPAPELDSARLDAARAEVCAALRECAPGFDPVQDDARAFADQVEQRTEALALAGWPVVALVQGAAADPDAELAARALRWLGARGQNPSRVRAALARSDLAPSALAALLDLGSAGIEELRRAPESPALRVQVLERLERQPLPAAATWIEDALPRARGERELRRRLLDALGACGSEAVAPLLRLATRGQLDEGELLARLSGIADADTAIGRLLGDGRSSAIDERLLLLCVAEVGTSGGWDWVEREARTSAHETEALLALARGTPQALAALLHLRSGSGTKAAELQRTLELVLREHPDSAAELARDATRAEIAGLYELASGAPEPALAPALIELAGSELLPEPDRRWSLLLVAEQGREQDLARLAALLPRLRERTLQAACLIALHAIGGDPALEAALEKRPAALRRRVRAAFDDPSGAQRNATTLARLARAIESSLPVPLP